LGKSVAEPTEATLTMGGPALIDQQLPMYVGDNCEARI